MTNKSIYPDGFNTKNEAVNETPVNSPIELVSVGYSSHKVIAGEIDYGKNRSTCSEESH